MENKQIESRNTRISGEWGEYLFGTVMKYNGFGFLVAAPVIKENSSNPYDAILSLALGGFCYVLGSVSRRHANLKAMQNLLGSRGENDLEIKAKDSGNKE